MGQKPPDKDIKNKDIEKKKVASTNLADRAQKPELSEDDLEAVSGGSGHCANGKHFAEATLHLR